MNRITVKVTDTNRQNWHRQAERLARAECARQGVEFRDAEVFAYLPERGRCMTKKPGYVSMTAHG